MFCERMGAAIEAAGTLSGMDELSREIWRAHAGGAVDDAGAQGLAERLAARRRAVRERIEPVGIPLGRLSIYPPRRVQRCPDRAICRDRRRLLACSGPMPPALASRFTVGQLAVLKIVGDETAANGTCALCVDAIAARAGVCRRLAQGAIRLAEGDGLITVEERRHQGRKNDPNVIRILSREWRAWLARGRRSVPAASPLAPVRPDHFPVVEESGCKKIRPTDRGVKFGDDSERPNAAMLPRGSGRL